MVTRASPPPAICGWQSPPCDAPARYRIEVWDAGQPPRWVVVCPEHLVFLRVHSMTGMPEEVI